MCNRIVLIHCATNLNQKYSSLILGYKFDRNVVDQQVGKKCGSIDTKPNNTLLRMTVERMHQNGRY